MSVTTTQTTSSKSAKASKDVEARLAELEALLAAKDAEIETLRRRPGVRRAFSKRNLWAVVIVDPKATIEQLNELAQRNGVEYKVGALKEARRQALDFIELAQQAGRWQDKS
jgi:hypothetical protein